jgi:hypothetical protein
MALGDERSGFGRSGSPRKPFARRYQACRRSGILVSNQTGPGLSAAQLGFHSAGL